MFCKKCYAKLDASLEFMRCPNCDYGFNPVDPRTYLARPFPGPAKIIGHVIATTIISLIIAYVVAFFQLAGASGH